MAFVPGYSRLFPGVACFGAIGTAWIKGSAGSPEDQYMRLRSARSSPRFNAKNRRRSNGNGCILLRRSGAEPVICVRVRPESTRNAEAQERGLAARIEE